MDPAWWSTDRTLSVETVARVVARQFPNLRGAAARKLGEGWDSEVFEIGGEWVLRFPKRAEVEANLDRERALLPELAERLPIAIPRFELFGRACEDFPYAFIGYRKLSGTPIQLGASMELSRAGERRIASQLGSFLGALHASASAVDRRELPLRRPLLSSEPAHQWRENITALREVDAALAARVEQVLDAEPAFEPPASESVLIHADLDLEHILVDATGERVSGIIDWGDVALGPAAHDFVGIYGWRGPRFVEQVLERYAGPVTPRDFAWLRLRSLSVALVNVAYGKLAERASYVRAGLHAARLGVTL